MSRVVAYVRVSTDKQADHGVSLEAQREKVMAYAALYDLEVVEVVVDAGASAKTLDREGLARVLELLGSGAVDGLLVAKLDRLTRSVRDLGELLDRYFRRSGGPALLSVAEQIDTRSAAGRLVLNILGSVSEWEREAIGERTSTAMRHKAARGEYTGGRVPYGFRLASDGVHLEEDPAEQAVLAAARAAHAKGLSLRAIARELARQGFTTRRGRAFHAKQVHRMVA
jgi:site-specific DNA recombinase